MWHWMDHVFIALGVDAGELLAMKSRRFAYLALLTMSGLSTCLVVGIVSNVTAAAA